MARRVPPGEDSEVPPPGPRLFSPRCPDHPEQLIVHYLRADGRGYCKECPPR